MSSFGHPPDPSAVKSYFPGISAKSFSPMGATVCYRESIKKENNARNDAYESEKLRQRKGLARERTQLGETLPGQGSIRAAYLTRGWSMSHSSGRWLPPDFPPGTPPDTGAGRPGTDPPRTAPSERPRSRGLPEMPAVADMWRTTSWTDFPDRPTEDFKCTVDSNAQLAELVKSRCGARSRPKKAVKSVSLAVQGG